MVQLLDRIIDELTVGWLALFMLSSNLYFQHTVIMQCDPKVEQCVCISTCDDNECVLKCVPRGEGHVWFFA